MARHIVWSLGAVAVVLGLTGCRTSAWEPVASYTDPTGVIRCVEGQVGVGEQADLTDGGDVPFGASTVARRDLYCVNDQPALGASWSAIEADVTLFAKIQGIWQVCARPPTRSSTDGGSITAAMAHECGGTWYYANATHRAYRSGVRAGTQWTSTPDVYVNPPT